MSVLANTYGSLLLLRPPAPLTCNKAGANYKSEVTHREYSPRQAYDEWLAICDAIVACGGDALYRFEEADEAFLDRGDLAIGGDGVIVAAGARLGHLDEIMTGRVFTANGPWTTLAGGVLRAVMPNMLAHRRGEGDYFAALLADIATAGGYQLELVANPHRWEGMADVAVIGERVILTHTVAGHYDQGVDDKTMRSSRAGGAFAATALGVPESACLFVELLYPHFHGDTVHFTARAGARAALLHYAGGLWPADRTSLAVAIDDIVPIDADDAAGAYAANSRQVESGVLVPAEASSEFTAALVGLGLTCHPIALAELFAKAGGGPGCATLYLPGNLSLPRDNSLRYSVNRAQARTRRERIPARVVVDADYFAGRHRG